MTKAKSKLRAKRGSGCAPPSREPLPTRFREFREHLHHKLTAGIAGISQRVMAPSREDIGWGLVGSSYCISGILVVRSALQIAIRVE